MNQFDVRYEYVSNNDEHQCYKTVTIHDPAV